MKRFLTRLAFLITLPLLILGCDNFLNGASPRGKTTTGSFSLSINGPKDGRTIMPAAFSQADIEGYYYSLVFTSASGGAPVRADRTYGDISAAVELSQGTWNLSVTAYPDEARSQPMARGYLAGISITAQPVSGRVTLKAVINEGAGTFRWDIVIASPNGAIESARMTITPTSAGGTLEQTIDLLEDQAPNAIAGSLELNAGYYNLTFRVSAPGYKTLVWMEVLHIYQNLESAFGISFSNDYFNGDIKFVTYQYNNGDPNGTESRLYGQQLAPPADPEWEGYSFVGWYRDEDLTAPYDFDEPVTDDIILYAKWLDYFGSNVADLAAKLTSKPQNTPETPYRITMTSEFDLGDMTAPDSGWRLLLEVIYADEAQFEEGKYVDLDISACTIAETTPGEVVFNYENSFPYEHQNKLLYLSAIHLPESVTSISSSAFYRSINLSEITLPSTLKSIGDAAFSDCASLALESLPSGLESIGESAFDGCTNLALTSLPNGITSIEANAFNSCGNLALESLPNGIISIGESAFSNCTNLALTSLPDDITSIGQFAFDNCENLALESLPDGITSIGSYAFRSCTSFTMFTLPASLTEIGINAFRFCTSLSFVTSLAETPPILGTGAFDNTHANLQIKVPAASIDDYKNIDPAISKGWNAYADRIVPMNGTYQAGSFTITFADLADFNDIAGPTLSRSGDGFPQEATIEFTEEYDSNSIAWDLYGVTKESPSFTLSLDPSNAAAYNIQCDLPGTHLLRVAVTKDGVPFSKTIIITVTE